MPHAVTLFDDRLAPPRVDVLLTRRRRRLDDAEAVRHGHSRPGLELVEMCCRNCQDLQLIGLRHDVGHEYRLVVVALDGNHEGVLHALVRNQ